MYRFPLRAVPSACFPRARGNVAEAWGSVRSQMLRRPGEGEGSGVGHVCRGGCPFTVTGEDTEPPRASESHGVE